MADDLAETVVAHIVDILAGECRLTLDDVAEHGDTPMGEIIAGLVHLNEDLEFREAQKNDALKQLEAAAAELQQHNEALLHSEERLTSLVHDLSSVIIRLPGDVVMIPLVGALDQRRADLIGERLLRHVANARAQTVILELSGISTIDEQSLDIVIGIAATLRLLGAKAILTGIQPKLASAILALHYDVSKLRVAKDVTEALAMVGQ